MNDKPEELVPPEQRERMLKEMNELIETFYWRAFKIGCHPFIEFCGVMGEYLKVAEQAHKDGIDFTNTTAHSGYPLPIQPYNARYLGEKLGCIYGPALQRPENRQEFLQAMGLAEPGLGNPTWIPSFYSKRSDGGYTMLAPNGCEYPLQYSDSPHEVDPANHCLTCSKCGRCHIAHSGSHDGSGMMRLPDGRVVTNHLDPGVIGPGSKEPDYGDEPRDSACP